MEVFKIAEIGVFSAILALTLRKWQPELAMATVIGAGVILVFCIADELSGVIYEFERIIMKCGIAPEYFKLVLKLSGIAYLSKFTADICRDSGESAIAGKIELSGKIMVFALTVPVISDFLELVINTLDAF